MSLSREPNAEPLAGYRLVEPLGSGGFGEAWKCIAPGGLFKAIKFVYGNLNSLDGDAACAEQEKKALQRIKEVRHPFVLSVERIDEVDGELIIVMELADKSLHDVFVEYQGTGLVGIPRDDLLRYMRDAAEALDHMFQKHHLQHLDIKPRNLFVISDRVKVADFGLVKTIDRQGGSGTMMGVTPLYASPETFGGKISEHSDQYSLAIVYHELLTGQRPFNGKNVRQLAMQHMAEEPELRALPEAERPVVARALAKDPAKRYPNCQAFVWALYKAWTPVRQEPSKAAGSGSGLRPKSLSDTMEDMLLEPEQREPAPSPPPVPATPTPARSTPKPGRATVPAGLAASDDEISLGDSGKLSPDIEPTGIGLTFAQPETGSLRPALIIGIGGFGRRALRELRCRLLDRFGDLAKIPLLRFLYIDTDTDAIKQAVRGSAEVAFASNEVYPLPLQPAGNYRRRNLDQLTEWLPREKLYAIPRSLMTHGSRALGRLAFADNYLRLLGRVRKELLQAIDTNTVHQTVSHTSLALRDQVPRIYVLAAAGGGGAGFVVDLGYAIRRLLQQIGHPEGELNSVVFCGAPTDPATPIPEQANLYATLTELNHFSDPTVQFSAQYSIDGPRLVEPGLPYATVYLMAQAHRSPDALRDSIAHLGSYLFHDLTTPLGLRLDRARHTKSVETATRFRSFGTYAVWFPRGLMLRLAARQACLRLFEDWQSNPTMPTDQAELAVYCAPAWQAAGLDLEGLERQIADLAGASFDGGLEGSLLSVLATLEEQSQSPAASDSPGGWARSALNRVLEWVGVSPTSDTVGKRVSTITGEWRKSRVSRALLAAIQKRADLIDQQLALHAFALMDQPGARVAAAESGIARFIQLCDEALGSSRRRLDQQTAQLEQSWLKLEDALRNCLADTGGFRLFGGRSARRLLRTFLEHLTTFAKQRLIEEVQAAGHSFFGVLRGKLCERLREMTFCRQRLRNLAEALSPIAETLEVEMTPADTEVTPVQSPIPSPESFWDAIRQSATVRVVVPENAPDLEVAAEHFISSLKSYQWEQLDQFVQDRVLIPQGGLHIACSGNSDLLRNLAAPLIDQAASFLGSQLPITDVAQVEVATEGQQAELPDWIRKYYENAAPLVPGEDVENQSSFLLIPASEAGTAFGNQARSQLQNLNLVRVFGQADLMFCREQGFLKVEDLDRLFQSCRNAYKNAAAAPLTSPHSRFDIQDWAPLDP